MTNQEKVLALKNVHDFADLPDDQLLWFAENTTELDLAVGDTMFSKGDSPEFLIVLLAGETHALRDENMRDGFVYIARAGDPATEITGKLPFSRMQRLEATSRAVEPTSILLFPVRLYPELFQKMPRLVERLVWNMSDRVRETTKTDEQRDKLMALGKLSAGLAHELNNPAAAAKRAANELTCQLEKLRQADLNLCRHELSHEQSRFLANFELAKIADLHDNQPLSALAQSDLENEVSDWLADRQIENGWEYAAPLAEAGAQTAELEKLETTLGETVLADALARIASQITVAKLVSDINQSASRISELVGAVKEYTYMDRAAVQDVDVHRALDNTLVILKYKLKKKNVEVVKDYDENLPHIVAFGSELNQMWTNLIDNAIDAVKPNGILKIRTKPEPNAVLIEIRDNGAGIPPENQAHIFEPFFTTKPIGEGTGLGLDTVARIARRHNAVVRFESKPGDTCFQIRLPVQQNAG